MRRCLALSARAPAIDLNLTSSSRDPHEPLPTSHRRYAPSHAVFVLTKSLITHRLDIHHAALKSSNGSAQIRSNGEPPRQDPQGPAILPVHGDRSRRIHVVLCRCPDSGMRDALLTTVVDVPREEGRTGTAGLEAPMGPLNEYRGEGQD